MEEFSHTLRKLRKGMRLTQSEMAEKMGLSMSYVHQLEAGKRTASDSVKTLVKIMSNKVESGLNYGDSDEQSGSVSLRNNTDYSAQQHKCRMIPVLGWAHAGAVVDYDEIDHSAAERVPTLCQDPKAFAIDIEGDSMIPVVNDRDQVIVMPSTPPHNGGIVVARLKANGVICRKIETINGKVRLVPANTQYAFSEHDEEDFDWIYPVFGTWSQIWRG